DLEVEGDLLRDEDATGLEGGVPGQAPVLTVDRGDGGEAGADVAEGGLGGAVVGGLEDDLLGDALDGQVADEVEVAALDVLDALGGEGALRVLLDVEEVRRLQVAVTVRGAGVDGGGLHRGVGRRVGEVVRDLDGALEVAEV